MRTRDGAHGWNSHRQTKMEATPRIARYLGAFAAGIFAGSSLALNFGQIQSLSDPTVPAKSMVTQFRIWNGHQSGFQSITALTTISVTLGHTIYSLIRRMPLNYNFLTSGLIMTFLIPVSTAFLRPVIDAFYGIKDAEISQRSSQLREGLHQYQTFQWLRIFASSAAFGILLVEPFQ